VIEKDTLVDRLVDELERQMHDGTLSPADRLPSERSLCAVFGVSRTTVREALKTLAVRGLVTPTRRGALVADPTSHPPGSVDLEALAARATIRDLYEVRKLLEVRTARWAALRATDDDAERLRETLDIGHSAENGHGTPNATFHDLLVAAARNPVLAQVHATSGHLFLHLPFYWQLFDADEVRSMRAWRHELARRWHHQILRAVEQHDPDEAEGAMFQHLDVMEKDLIERLQVPEAGGETFARRSHPSLSISQLGSLQPTSRRSGRRPAERG
jgi:GntR family transcriptional regulator, transcriptional repressor for pyruvate dehydrogenase complex